MKILVVSDQESRYIWDHFDKSVFSGVELILSAGDLSSAYLEFLVSMVGAPLLYVPGNHDYTYVTNPPGGCESVDGRLVAFKGLRILGFGGCKSDNNQIFQYSEKQMTNKVNRTKRNIKRSYGFDILLTHAPSYGLGDGEDLFHQGFVCFRNLLDEYNPKYQIYGHQHKSYTHILPPENYGSTKLINAFCYKILDIN